MPTNVVNSYSKTTLQNLGPSQSQGLKSIYSIPVFLNKGQYVLQVRTNIYTLSTK